MTSSSHTRGVSPHRPHTLLLVGLLLAVVVILTIKGRLGPQAADTSAAPGDTPAAQLAQARAAGQPALVFFHSTTCESCVYMSETIAEVWPAYHDQVALVDVNVYDQENAALLQAERVRVIPTMVFIDAAGARQVEIGPMQPELLQQRLTTLAAGG
jgi:thioredoxin-like negative regulator of GroEL